MAIDADHAENCRQPAGVVAPVIHAGRCEGKGNCVRVCPYDVFEIRALTREEDRRLPLFARLRIAFHGGRQGFVVRPDACHACGLCVSACPENAIRLERV